MFQDTHKGIPPDASLQPYESLVDRINRFPQGAPPNENLYRILQILFSHREAELVAQMPIRPFTLAKISKIWKMQPADAQKVLDELAGRALIVDIETDREITYALPAPMAGFFEFSMMRTRDDVDQKLLADLYYQYCTVEEDFIRSLFINGETQIGRVLVNEPVLPETHVMDYERSSAVIRSASQRGISMCFCRHKAQLRGHACAAPLEICMSFNTSAASLIRAGYAREVDAIEGLDLLQQAYEHNLVQFGDNVREGVNFICNCCGCCCEALVAARRFSAHKPIHTTNFIPVVNTDQCSGCGKCVSACPVEAMTLVSANDPHQPLRKTAKLHEDVCLGCGVCVRVCSHHSVALQPRPQRVITPLNGTHRIIMMAIERGKLHELIVDNHVLASQRALAAVLAVILKLPPLKQALASQQVKSRYLEALISRYGK